MESRTVLTRAEAREAMQQMLRVEVSDIEVAALLGALAGRGETAEEIAGFSDAMRAAVTPLPLEESERSKLVDTCGTGGDQSGTFNISTAAALVAAAAGATVAKHGNRAVTSRCGSADVLEALGIPVNLTPAAGATMLRARRFAFLHAPSLHPAMKAVMPVRRRLGVRTVFNILGPLTNPAGALAQVMGVYQARLVHVVAQAMAMLGTRHAFVVFGETDLGGMDEFSISGTSHFAEVRGGEVRLGSLIPEDLGVDRVPVEVLRGGGAEVNAGILRGIFAGERGPRRDVVVLNAAAVLVTAGLAADLAEGMRVAGATIDRGEVTALVARLGESAGE